MGCQLICQLKVKWNWSLYLLSDRTSEKFQSYCEKHSVASKKVGCEAESDAEEGAPKKKKDWTSEQKNQARAAKLRQIESEFYKHVDVLETSNFLDIDFETTETIFNYWKLKRRVMGILLGYIILLRDGDYHCWL